MILDSELDRLNSLKPNLNELCSYTCQKCKQRITRQYKDIKNRPQSCPVCAGKKVIQGFNDALTAQPEITKIWSDENQKIPQDFTKQSGRKVHIKCLACGETTQRKMCDVVKNPKSCSYCSGRIVIPGKNDLKTKYPKLALEWSPNNFKKANETYPYGRMRGLWKCLECHQEWETVVYSRVKYQTGCPYCANQKPIPGINDVSSNPSLIKHWDTSKNNIQPNEILRGSNTKVWWKCIKGHSHYVSPNQKWDTKNNRVRKCPSCLRRERSYGEIELKDFLSQLGHKIICNNRQILKPFEIDLWLPDQKIAIEFNGIYWHSDKIIQGKYDISAHEYHERKKQLAHDSNVKIVFVWADDWIHNRIKIMNALKRVIRNPNDIDPLISITSKG